MFFFQILCGFHSKDKTIGDSLYWDTVSQIYGTLGIRSFFNFFVKINSIFFANFRLSHQVKSTADVRGTLFPNVVFFRRDGSSSGSTSR